MIIKRKKYIRKGDISSRSIIRRSLVLFEEKGFFEKIDPVDITLMAERRVDSFWQMRFELQIR